jgi:hypothetical protein
MAEEQMTRYAPPSSPRLDLERKLTNTLGNGQPHTVAELRQLLAATEEAIVLAEEEAARAKEAALDPTVTPDPAAARAAAEDTALAAGRLRTLHARLLRHTTAVAEAARLRRWQHEFRDLKKERDALAQEFAQVYPTVCAQLVDLFARTAALDQRLSKLHESRAAGVALHLDSVELSARELERFTRDVPSLLTTVTLFDLKTGKQVWPPVVPRDMSLFAPVVPADPAHSPDWWRPEVQAARNAEAAAEAQRVAEYYEQQNKQREEREKHGHSP